MKRLLTLLSTLAFACTLSMPVFAAKSPKPAKAQETTTTTAVHNAKTTKSHRKHSKKHAMKSSKKQKAMTPAPTSK